MNPQIKQAIKENISIVSMCDVENILGVYM